MLRGSYLTAGDRFTVRVGGVERVLDAGAAASIWITR